jgi:hypothetical protein
MDKGDVKVLLAECLYAGDWHHYHYLPISAVELALQYNLLRYSPVRCQRKDSEMNAREYFLNLPWALLYTGGWPKLNVNRIRNFDREGGVSGLQVFWDAPIN